MAKQSISEQYREKMKDTLQKAESKYAQAKLSRAKGNLTWLEADAEQLRNTVAAVIEDGAAVLLAKTSDGGALVLRVIDEGESPAWYPASEQAIHDDLAEIAKIAIDP